MTDNPIFVGSRHRVRRWRNHGMEMGFGFGVDFLFRDDFITDEAAPLTSPRTAEPGPGVSVITDTDNDALAIVASELVFSNTNAVWGDPGYWSNSSFVRASGLCFYNRIANIVAGSGFRFGIDTDRVSFSLEGFSVTVLNISAALGGGTTGIIGVLTAPENYFFILRSTGAFLVQGQTLLWVENSMVSNPVFLSLVTLDKSINVGTSRVSQLPSPWDTDYGIATDRLAGARAPGDTFTHEADFLGEFIQTTVPTAGFTSFQFRRQDATNYWEVIIEPSQDLTLREVVAGVPAARGVAVGVVNNGDRIVVIADGTTIRVYEQNTLRITYALAANFQTETDGSLLALGVAGAVSDIVTWPRVLSGAALRALNRVADA